jgi:predicted ester cyclase
MNAETPTTSIASTARNVAVIRDLIERFFNGHNPGLAGEFFTPDLRWHGGSVGSIDGANAYADVMRGFFTALPDVHAAEQEMLADGDRVAARLIFSGTHRGPLWGLPPTGAQVKWNAIMTYRLVDGKIAEQWAAEDWVAILHDIDAFIPPWAHP